MQANKLAERVGKLDKASLSAAAEKIERKDLVLLALLFVAHACCFLPICFQVGFYLDDWLTFWNLHFAPHNFVDLLKASFSDPRMVTRPVQCWYYATTYFFFGDRPLPYHLLRFTLEFAGASLLYLGMKRLSTSQFVAALSALIFLLYPTHDSTHYWIGGGLGPGFGLTLFLASFCVSMHAYTSSKKSMHLLAVLLYGFSAFCYESFLPMLVLNFCGVLLLSSECRTESRLSTMGSVIGFFVPFMLLGLLEPIYQRVFLPNLAHVYLSPSTANLAYFCNVFVQGLNVSFFAELWSFLASRVRESIISFSWISALQLLGVLLASTAIVFISYGRNQYVKYRRLFTAGILTFFASYLTFAVAAGYTPVLDTMINRVNIGASVAVSILIALSIKWLVDRRSDLVFDLPQGLEKRALKSAIIVLPLVTVMVLANLAMASFWICSWNVQKDVRWLISQNKQFIKDDDAIILAGTHRYLMWAPVFDGTWDFQSMLRMTLNKKDIAGGVVSDRLSISDNRISDISAGYNCATYDASKIKLLVPSSQATLLPVHSNAEFIDVVEKTTKQTLFPVSVETVKRWRAAIK